MAEDLGAPSATAENGKEQSWRLTFEISDIGGIEIYVSRRVILRDASNNIVDRVDNESMVEYLFPSSKFKKTRQLTSSELNAAEPGILATLNAAVDAAVLAQKASE